MNLKPGWCEIAGREAGERERGERVDPIGNVPPGTPKRHWVPVLPQQRPDQLESVRRAGQVSGARKRLARKLDQVLGKVD
jgi:hypothetical protein